MGGRSQPRGFAAALGRRWRVAHNSTGPTTAEGGLNLTRKRSGLHLMNALLRSWVSGPPLCLSLEKISAGRCGGCVCAQISTRGREPGHLRALDNCGYLGNGAVLIESANIARAGSNSLNMGPRPPTPVCAGNPLGRFQSWHLSRTPATAGCSRSETSSSLGLSAV